MTTTFGSLNLSNILEYVNIDGKETYSFLIQKETDSNNPYTFENLHLVKIPQGYLAYILEWIPNEQWLESNNYSFDLQTFTGTQKHYDLEYNLIQKTEFINGQNITLPNASKQNNRRDMVLVCVETVSSLCNGYPYDCGGSICGFGYSSDCSMVYVAGGGGTGGNGTSSGGGSGGGSVINTNDTETDHHDSTSNPVDSGAATVVAIAPEFIDPCEQLSVSSQDTGFLQAMQNLDTQSTTLNKLVLYKAQIVQTQETITTQQM